MASRCLPLLLGLLTLVSYVDRALSRRSGKFLSREFQDNIDAFEKKSSRGLGVSRARASLSMAMLTQLTTAAIAMIVAFRCFRDNVWTVHEIVQATVSMVLMVIVCNRCCHLCFFREPMGSG